MNKMSLQKSIQNFGIKQALKYMEKDPEENIPKLMDMVDKFAPDGWYEAQRNMIRKVIKERGNWYQLILRIYQLDPEVRKAFFQNFIFNASLKGSALQEQLAEENNCNIPWAILLDPTSACNLHCTGCWAAEYGHQLNLDLDTIDSIVRQGKELGTYMYIYTGGEPLVRKKDLIKICEMHPDCEFLSFTNGTLIDEEFCQEMLRVKNFVPAISLEGFETANDGRRGEGVFDKVQHAMSLLKSHGLPFGISTCYTRKNLDDVTSEKFFDMLVESGALFVWFFHYMPVGMMQQWNFCLHLSSVRKFSIVSVSSVRQRQYLAWISRMTHSSLADVLPVEEDIYISMPRVMWSHAYLFIIPMQIFMTAACWML